MSKIIRHSLFGIFIFIMAFTTMPTCFPANNFSIVNVEAKEITPRADVIYWRYRTLASGTVQKRRWNETRGYWVDPHWINVN